MSPRPGVEVSSRAARSARGDDTQTGPWFVTGSAERGPVGTATRITSLQEYVDTYGDRVSYGQLYDSLDLAFAEGLAVAYVSRVGGSGQAKASRNLPDRAGSPINTLRIDALYFGTYGTRISVAVENGTPANTYTLIVLFDGVEVERFKDLANPAAAVAATATSKYVRAVDLASATAPPNNNPQVTAALALTGGADPHLTSVEADWTAALTAFTRDLGPGQVSAPGRTTTAAHQALIDHAKADNRTAYLDSVDQASLATLQAAAAALNAYSGSEYAGLFGSWIVFPGLTVGTTRVAPGSAFAAGLTARRDAASGVAAQAPAGAQGVARYALDVRAPAGGFTDAQFETLNAAGVNMARLFRTRGLRLYGFRSLSLSEDWKLLSYHRERMSLVARAEVIADAYVFRTIDGKGQVFSDLNGELSALCLGDWPDALHGKQPEDAFYVDTGPTVNTPATIAAGEIRAVIYARFAPFAELVKLDIVKTPLTASVQGDVAA